MNYYYYYYHHFSIVFYWGPTWLSSSSLLNQQRQPTNQQTNINTILFKMAFRIRGPMRTIRTTDKKKWKKQIRKERNQRNCYHENGRDIRDSTNLGPVTDFPIGRNQKFHPSDRNAIHNQWSTMHDPLHPIIYPFSQFQHTRDDIPNSRNPQNPLQTNETKFIVSNSKIEFKL